VQAGVEMPSSVVDLDRRNAKGLVMLVGFDPATQAAFGSYRLTDGKTTLGQDLAPNDVLISVSLADALQARPGDLLRVAVDPQQALELRVAGIAEAEGPGAYTLRPALFSPLANLGPLIGDQGINVIRLAAPGEGQAELDRAHELAPLVRLALEAMPGGPNLNVREAKGEEVNALVKRAEEDKSIFTGLSLFVALTGAALVVNLGLALAEERRPRHAVLRALGLSRAGMITLSVLEGGLYSLAAAVAALLPGAVVELGDVLVEVLTQVQDLGDGHDPVFTFRLGQLLAEQGQLNVAVDADSAVDDRVLEDHPDVALTRLEPRHSLLTEVDLAARRLFQPRDHPHQGRLAAPGRPEQAGDFRFGEAKGDVIDRRQLLEGLGQPLDADFRHAPSPPGRFARPRE